MLSIWMSDIGDTQHRTASYEQLHIDRYLKACYTCVSASAGFWISEITGVSDVWISDQWKHIGDPVSCRLSVSVFVLFLSFSAF